MAATYRLEFYDRLDVKWKIDFLIDGGGAVSTIKGASNPLDIEYLSSSKELFDSPIKGSAADINILSRELFQWIGLYAEGDLDTVVNIYYDNGGYVLFWTGYVVSGAYQEPYDHVPVPVTIHVGDGLGYLKKMDFDDAGTPYTGRKTDAWIVWTILSKLGATSFSEYINLYEDTMNTAAADSPLDQVETDVGLFDDDDCYNVLEEVLRKYNACIRQVAGVFIIYRPLELYNATTKGRTFTSATVKGAAGDLIPNELFSRVGAVTDMKQHNGGYFQIQPAAENMDIIQDFGENKSWIQTHEFKEGDYNWSTNAFANWTANGACATEPVNVKVPGEGEGVLITSHNTHPDLSKYISQEFGSDLVTAAADETWISIDWQWINQCGSERPDLVFLIVITDNAGNWWLKDGDDGGKTASWDAGSTAITFQETAPVGNSGWQTYARPITGGVPVDGPYTVKIYAPRDTNPTVYLAIKNIRMYSTSNEVRAKNILRLTGINFDYPRFNIISEILKVAPVVEETTSYTPGAKGIDMEYVYLLGDVDPAITNITNTIEQFAGCLTLTDNTETTAWSTRTPGGESDKLLVLIAGELSIQYARPRQALSVPVYELDKTISAIPAIKLLGSFQDSLNQYNAVNRRFVFNSGRFSIRYRHWELDLIEIISTIP